MKIVIGFSHVYKGTWRGRTIAIKCLVESTLRFPHEVSIWKELQHPNVLELCGASGVTGDEPLFSVCLYECFGSLNSGRGSRRRQGARTTCQGAFCVSSPPLLLPHSILP